MITKNEGNKMITSSDRGFLSPEPFKVSILGLKYNHPLDVPPNYSAQAETRQGNSNLSVDNLSVNFTLTFAIAGMPDDVTSDDGKPANGIHTIPANSSMSINLYGDMRGQTIRMSNVSTRQAVARVTLTGV